MTPDIEKPMVITWVEGGIGYTAVVRGDVEVLSWDWDVIVDGTKEEIEAAIAEADRLPDEWPDKAGILQTMREILSNLFGNDD